MNSESFIEAIKEYVREAAITSTLDVISSPPGRSPSDDRVKMAEWHSSLPTDQQVVLKMIIREAVDEALFGLLCVLDGVRAVEDANSRGYFELHHIGKAGRTLLNDGDKEYLHDIYNE